MTCHLFCVKPLSEPMLAYGQLDLKTYFDRNTSSFVEQNEIEIVIFTVIAMLSWSQSVNP